jgi:hypothetical protein
MDDRHAVEVRYRDYWRSEMRLRRAPEPGEWTWEAGMREPAQFWEKHAGVTVEDVELEGAYPDTQLVVVFHEVKRPECRYAWRWAVWPDGEPDPEPGMGDRGGTSGCRSSSGSTFAFDPHRCLAALTRSWPTDRIGRRIEP